MSLQIKSPRLCKTTLTLLLVLFLWNNLAIVKIETEPLAAMEAVSAVEAQTAALETRSAPPLSSRQELQSEPEKILILEATAYTHTGNTTYTGVYPQVGTIAVDPRFIPLGSKMWVEGYGFGVAQDTGGLIKGGIIDVFMETEAECLRWGRRRVKVYLY